MYFIFPENLPEPVIKAALELTSETSSLYHFITPDTEISNRAISIAIPDEATHIRSIRFTTPLSSFLYYFPDKGYKIALGIHLPELITPVAGSYYAGGIIIRTGKEGCEIMAEPEITMYKGTVLAIHEQSLNYYDALIYCETISENSSGNWHLPDTLDLTSIYNKKQTINSSLLKLQGSLLNDEKYWCRDNSVIDLGVAFDMETSSLDILSKRSRQQVRPVLNF
ncbi:hypothetical protein [Parabacteroides sp. AM08-6]|uniref:hypothetical protein n=1 Tax=Parabacteroides sp. AM08-6 TaxID=2292053 RepID=UPI000F0043DA|nr:hypothetical protein [Parabacteroides sp. AM08-6]RHJ76998.1 hypothetical protein DW103_16320 [Parabacteroides sp. AM08-6]